MNSIKKYWPYAVGIMIALIGIISFLYYQNIEPLPIVDTNGEVSGNYSIANIMRLKQSYLCIFEKSDGNSKIEGGIFTNSTDIYGEFDVQLGTSTEAKTFNSFLLVKAGRAYTWTSLANVGNTAKAAKSAINAKSVSDQAQIVGRNDKLDFKCRPQKNGISNTFFAVPDWITFSESKN
jgi:hypothetical protein